MKIDFRIPFISTNFLQITTQGTSCFTRIWECVSRAISRLVLALATCFGCSLSSEEENTQHTFELLNTETAQQEFDDPSERHSPIVPRKRPTLPKPLPPTSATTQPSDVPEDDDMRQVLQAFNAQFAQQERINPKEAYHAIFTEGPTLQAHLHPRGASRQKSTDLSGIPANRELYQKTCTFCPDRVNSMKTIQVYNDGCRAVVSRRRQILVIPKEHYVHWFEVPVTEQQQLLQHAIDLRKQYPDLIRLNTPIMLHCGAALTQPDGHENQTVFHVHVRTSMYV